MNPQGGTAGSAVGGHRRPLLDGAQEERAEEFARLIVGHEAFISFVTLAEVKMFLAMDVLSPGGHEALASALDAYTVLPARVDHIVAEWVKLRAVTIRSTSADDRERRQNDTWIAACALSVEPPLPNRHRQLA